MEMSKPEAKYLEETGVPGPYSSLSPDDGEFMQRYEGKTGRAVVRKVRNSDGCRGIAEKKLRPILHNEC